MFESSFKEDLDDVAPSQKVMVQEAIEVTHPLLVAMISAPD